MGTQTRSEKSGSRLVPVLSYPVTCGQKQSPDVSFPGSWLLVQPHSETDWISRYAPALPPFAM
ncbi:uncharacterized protein RAG0_01551 [Rhynchosporium agropyri]|uniref:Uncharacterized protein n=1 Tax=Rhynchosporium agropyri TaxID=914238 RepID=A0A1E1JXE7_9HELO|nr:uncharacterized protein RAG0_01551 [Rhynchosporium agropyri]